MSTEIEKAFIAAVERAGELADEAYASGGARDRRRMYRAAFAAALQALTLRRALPDDVVTDVDEDSLRGEACHLWRECRPRRVRRPPSILGVYHVVDRDEMERRSMTLGVDRGSRGDVFVVPQRQFSATFEVDLDDESLEAWERLRPVTAKGIVHTSTVTEDGVILTTTITSVQGPAPVHPGQTTRVLCPYDGGPPQFIDTDAQTRAPADPLEAAGFSIIHGTREDQP